MARNRRRSSGVPKAAPPDLGTPETRARLQPPPWDAWPSELKLAAIEIDMAVRLLAGSCLAQAQNTARGAHGEPADWDDDSPQARVVRRYCGWRTTMRAIRWDGQAVLDAVVLGSPPEDPWLLRRALHLYATGRVLG